MLVETRDQVISVVQAHGAEIKALGVRRVGLFGSFARGDPHADSDVDVLVEFEPGRKTFSTFMSLALLLEDLLGRRVELVTPESLSPYIGPRILEEIEDVALSA